MNRWKHRWKRAASLAGAALVLAAGLAACAPAEESSSLAGEESSQLALENDGATTQLVVAEISHSPERTAALEEIAAKYMADFPQTRVEIVTVEDSQEALAMLEGGQADLVELSQQEQPGAVEQGLLVDLEPYLDVWEERSSLTMAAKAVLSSMGNGRAFLMPITLNQDLVYYRSDWFEAYNQDKTEGLVYCRIWEDFIDAAEKLSDKGAAGLVFGGQEHLVDLFDSVLWSTTNVGRMADTAASYFSNVEGNTTLFTLEHAASAVEQFAQLVESAVPQEALTWTEDQAVEAFINGEAITLIAGQDRMEEIAAAMDEGACKLGECALVPYDSPINRSGILFYNTLFDENASCHLALGMGYSSCLKDFEKYTPDEARELGVNDSMIHEDFMIGSPDLRITGITADGREVPIFINGDWAE